ncbi:hypothetical protein GCM10017562_58570 [Streptomyces roseofulvus]
MKATSAPSRASRTAVAAPMPRLPPVTSTAVPFIAFLVDIAPRLLEITQLVADSRKAGAGSRRWRPSDTEFGAHR